MSTLRPRRGLDEIVSTALELLDEQGLEKVTLRGVARKLDAHLNTVSYQVKTKAQLMELMADAILADAHPPQLPGDPAERIHAVAEGLRRALLSRRDGARLVNTTESFQANTLRLAETLAAAVLELGADQSSSIRAMYSIQYIATGLALEEQIAQEQGPPTQENFDALPFPTLKRLGHSLVQESFDDRLRFGVDAIVTAISRETD